MPEPAPHPTRAVLALPSFRYYLASRLQRSMASTLLGATIAWQVFDLTGSAFALGLLGLVEFLPVIPLGLIAGAYADSRDRLAIVRFSQAGMALAAAGLWALAESGLPGSTAVAGVFALALGVAALNTWENPAGAAILPGLVPREIFQNAVAVAAAFRNLAWASGPVAAGFAIAAGGPARAYAIAAALLAGSALALTRVRAQPVDAPSEGVSWAAIREGLVFVRGHQPVLGAMTLDLFAVIFAGATALLPVYAEQLLDVGPRGYGLLAGALQIGAMIMAALLLWLPPFERPGRALLWAVGGFGLATIAFGLSRSFALSVGALVLAGMADQVSMVARSTIIQLSTPDALRGRVNSVNSIFIGASNELGSAESGFLAAVTSATFSVVAGGFACLAALGGVAVRLPGVAAFRVAEIEDPPAA